MTDAITNTVLASKTRKMFFLALAAALTAGFMLLAHPGTASAHGESINVTPTEAGPGDSVVITGDDFPAGEEIELSLEGVRGSVALTHATAAEDGTFSATVELPVAAAGSYQLVGATADDNIALDFKVLEGAGTVVGAGTTNLRFERSNLEVIIVGLMAVALAVGGTYLVVTSRRAHA